MDTGMLWFDDSGRTFGAKLKDALAYYRKKEFFPTKCIGSAKDSKARRYSGKTVHGILVTVAANVQTNHLFLV